MCFDLSDMDLFVQLDEPESLENLETLYNALQSSSLAVPGSLVIVRCARVPIVKYTDALGSGTNPSANDVDRRHPS